MRLRRLPLLSACLSSLLLALVMGPVQAEEAAVPSDPAAELARAGKLKSEAASLRSAADARFNAEEIACYERFLVNRCIDESRARRVADVRKARELDNEAGRIELAEKNRRFNERQAEEARDAPKKAVERAEQEARNRADSESRLRQFSEKDAARVKREQDGKSQAMQAAADRNRKDAADARRRAAEARAAEGRAEQAKSDRTDYDERARKAAEKKAEKARKAASGQSSGADTAPLLGK
ncbi:MAG TPA: hypothetical protein PKZ19_11035 [Zoogloea sp.]|nr:hypothetical protein [Zoogloea sp.]